MKTKFIVLMLLILFAGVAQAARSAPAADTLEKWVIGAGGAQVSSGDFALQYTLGQPVTGEVEMSGYNLCSGYLCDPIYRVYLPVALRVP